MDIESVYTQYFKDVFLYVRSLSADAGTAEEIAQETFMLTRNLQKVTQRADCLKARASALQRQG